MPQRSPACPDCKVPMDSGFIVDFTGSEWSKQSSWAEGTAKRTALGNAAFQTVILEGLTTFANSSSNSQSFPKR